MGMMGIWANGGEPFKGTTPNFQDPKVGQALTAFSGRKHAVRAVSPAAMDYQYADILTAFQQGKAVIAMEWDAAASTLTDPEAVPDHGRQHRMGGVPLCRGGWSAPTAGVS